MAQQANPLEQLVANEMTVHDLLNIYKRYAPQPLSIQDVQANSHGDENLKVFQILLFQIKDRNQGMLMVTQQRRVIIH